MHQPVPAPNQSFAQAAPGDVDGTSFSRLCTITCSIVRPDPAHANLGSIGRECHAFAGTDGPGKDHSSDNQANTVQRKHPIYGHTKMMLGCPSTRFLYT